MTNIGKSLLNVNELLPPFEDSQGYYQRDDPIVLFALALDDQWPLIHLLVLHLPLVQRWVVGFVHRLELNQLLLAGHVQYCRSQVWHCRVLELQQVPATVQHQVH